MAIAINKLNRLQAEATKAVNNANETAIEKSIQEVVSTYNRKIQQVPFSQDELKPEIYAQKAQAHYDAVAKEAMDRGASLLNRANMIVRETDAAIRGLKYPHIMDEATTIAGEMQYNQAKERARNLSVKSDLDLHILITEIEEAISLQRIDYASVLFDEFLGSLPTRSSLQQSVLSDLSYQGRKGVDVMVDLRLNLYGTVMPKLEIQFLSHMSLMERIENMLGKLEERPSFLWLPAKESAEYNDTLEYVRQRDAWAKVKSKYVV